MPDITAELRSAIDDEPPLGLRPADVILAARRVKRRRRACLAGGVGAVAAVAVGAVAAVAAGSAGPAPAHTGQLSLAALTRTATSHPKAFAISSGHASADGVTAAQVFTLFQQSTGTPLASAQASVLAPSGDLDLSAGLALPGQPSLNIQVTPAGTMETSTPTCFELSDLSSGSGDGYFGPCTIKRLSDGSILIERSGRTTTGGYAMAQATLIRPDGSGVFAEDTNQALTSVKQQVSIKEGKPALPPVLRAEPAVGTRALTNLVLAIAARTSS
ncbi:MAG TPA: hypothetical protein VGH27_07740 [Streptosporangiaceae bacterium]|jgi:hypothetical protein